MSINRKMDKDDVVCAYNGTLAVKKNEIFPFATTEMDLQGISEISQTEKDKYCMISVICVI